MSEDQEDLLPRDSLLPFLCAVRGVVRCGVVWCVGAKGGGSDWCVSWNFVSLGEENGPRPSTRRTRPRQELDGAGKRGRGTVHTHTLND
jgi:hypothetical protein